MQTVVRYLETINEINAAERDLEDMLEGWKGGRAHLPEETASIRSRVESAYQAAETAWAAIAPEVRGRLHPPSSSLLATLLAMLE